MAVESASDRLAFLEDFGEAVTWTKQGGGPVEVTAIFDSEYIEVSPGGEIGFASLQPRLTVRTADIPGAKDGDQVTVAGVNYTLRVVQPDGTGMTMLVIEKD